MRHLPGIGPARQLSCRVELAWPGNHGLWWNPHLQGTHDQIAGALDELAVRVRIDPLTRVILRVDPAARIRCNLELSAAARILTHHHPAVDLAELPALLREHARAIRGRTSRH
ncbi:hypothetical protein [Nocardia bovistercoris]|uniref:Uncharacterized protein n=1 Tax=Nocardia bovistercoris TaxID=2785916 RepID=A0A931MYW6_9NOCA|nr:hypothetical protein [Nocardia bovistercoris]MBH0775490.1 hypothetical protein [Nocardia bovistercoris]